MDTKRRALVAAVVGVLGATIGVAGLGHAYLREWRRAVAWFAFVLGSGVVLVLSFTDPVTATPQNLPAVVVVPVFVLLGASILDAYYVARKRRTSSAAAEDLPSCPHCGKPIDPSIDFCWYCTEPYDDADVADDFDGVRDVR